MVSRKFPPGMGGMEAMSAKLVEEVGNVVPVTAIARNVARTALPLFLTTTALRLLAGLLARRIAVVHLHDAVLAPLGWLARPFGVPVVVTLHGLDITYPTAPYRIYFRTFARRFAAYTCVSRHVSALAKASGIPADRLHVVPNGVAGGNAATSFRGSPSASTDAEALRPNPTRVASDRSDQVAWPWPENAPLLLTVGRLVPRKGVRWFVDETFPAIHRRFPALHYAIAGAGPDASTIRAAIGSSGLQDYVHLLGEVSEAQKLALMRRATVVVMPNLPIPGDAEGFGIAALEAAYAGRALVAADIEGLRDAVIQCRTGVRVAAGDRSAWFRAIECLLTRPSLAGAIGRRARRTAVTSFDWRHVATRYCEVYRGVLARTE